MNNSFSKLSEAIKTADAVVIGAGAGLSASAGFSYSGERFEKYFPDFIMMQRPPDELWAYWSRNIYINRYMDPPRPVYDMLLDVIRDKDYFVLTTNVDHCFQKAGFDKSRLFYTQGDYGQAFAPDAIKARSICISGDIGEVLEAIKEQ